MSKETGIVIIIIGLVTATVGIWQIISANAQAALYTGYLWLSVAFVELIVGGHFLDHVHREELHVHGDSKEEKTQV